MQQRLKVRDIQYLIERLIVDLAEFLMADYNLELKEALNVIYESDTYAKISDPATGLYYQGSKYVYTYLQNELKTGSMVWLIYWILRKQDFLHSQAMISRTLFKHHYLSVGSRKKFDSWLKIATVT